MERPSFRFTAPFNVETIEVKGQEHVFLEGIISSTHIDLVSDMVTKNCLESMKRQILEKNLKLDIEHEAFRGDSVEEKELNKTKVPAGKMFDADVKATERGQFALFVKSELNPFNERYANIKGNVQEGFLDAYSIAFIPTKVSVKNIEGKEVRMLDDMALLNVALTGNPINTAAKNQEVFMKSIESLEDYKKEKKSNPAIQGQLEVKSHSSSEEEKSIKLQEVNKKMTEEENKETIEEAVETEESAPEAEAEVAEETKDEEEVVEEEAEAEPEAESESNEEVKALTEKMKSMEAEMAELKAKLRLPVRKSKVEAVDKAEQFEVKSRNPLDLIA